MGNQGIDLLLGPLPQSLGQFAVRRCLCGGANSAYQIIELTVLQFLSGACRSPELVLDTIILTDDLADVGRPHYFQVLLTQSCHQVGHDYARVDDKRQDLGVTPGHLLRIKDICQLRLSVSQPTATLPHLLLCL